jgi:outer membrane protein assembly factor BamD
MRPARCLLFALGLAFGLSGCDLDKGARHATLSYTDDARAAYEEAMVAFRDKDWESARALFGEVRKRFAYSRYARLAELRLAEIEFEQEKYSEAITAYREFTQSHRNDPDIEYARYRMSKALFLDIDDTLFLPPHEERDQATAMDAHRELRGFLRDFPKSRYRTDVAYMLEVVMSRLARHELYVARYYLKQDNFEAAKARIDYALKTYPESNLVPEALVLKGETLMKLKRFDEARAVFAEVLKKHGGPFAKTARRFLAELDARASGQRGEPPAKAKEAPPDQEGRARTLPAATEVPPASAGSAPTPPRAPAAAPANSIP